MATLKHYFNKIFQPLLLVLGITPPLFSGPDEFSTFEFPHCQFPLAVQDWRDALVFFYESGDAKTRQHSKSYKVVEVARYTFREAGAHQVVIAKVDVQRDPFKLLRIERDGTAKDVEVGEADIEAPEPMDLPAPRLSLDSNIPGSSTDPVQALPESTETPPTAPSPHPSIAVYSKPGVNEKDGRTNPLADTVQTTFEHDLRTLVLVERFNPTDFFLHHLALLVAEVHNHCYRSPESEHQCVLFAELTMRAISGLAEKPGEGSNGIKGKAPVDGEVDEVSEILHAYRTLKDVIDNRIADKIKVDVQKDREIVKSGKGAAETQAGPSRTS